MILDGRAVSERRLTLLKEKIAALGVSPGLATVIAGDDPASKTYVRMKHQACEKVGIRSTGIEIPADTTTVEVIHEIHRLNSDPLIDGILVQLPLPSSIDTSSVIESVLPSKDVDGFHPCNLGRLFSGMDALTPCTPLGIINLLGEYAIPIEGKDVVIIGRSVDVGRPLAALFLNNDATVTVCHSRTKTLPVITKSADILVSAVGRAGFVTGEMVRNGAVVIDVGINYVNGNLCGDVDFPGVSGKASFITPVPGGVGPMTIATLMENTLKAAVKGQ
jgi:methylenetetrahydrofolate dehydrogenase (NADP+)/methenyltetrahydrofolate cyclohydrolase